jgi:isopenicillin N synthase-like dioxygenase
MIPTLDFGTFLKGSFEERMDLAKTLVDGFKTHGFVKLINHGVNEEIIKKYQEAVC